MLLRNQDASSFSNGFSITPSDVAEITETRGIFVGVSGNLRVQTAGGDDLTFATVPVGIFPVKAIMVYATSTTASSLVGVY